MSSDKKQVIKIKQFQWYEVQTKVRQIMVQLLQPFNKKQTQQSIRINEVKRNIATISKKLEDHDFLLDRENASKPTYIELQDKKIAEIQEYAKNSQLQTEGKIKKMEAIIEVYEGKIKQLNSLEMRLDKEVIQRVQDFKQYKQGVDRQLQLMTKKQDSLTEQINQFKNITKAAVAKMEGRMIAFDNRLRELEDDSRHKATEIKKLLQQTSIHNEKIIKLQMKTSNLNARVQDRERDSKLSQKFLTKVKQVESDLKFMTTFLQQYQPLYIQMHISQTLHSFIQGKQRRKLCVYQQQRFARLHHHILMDEKLALEDLMSAYTSNIRKIINRNKKYIINLAVAESVKYGANVYQFRIDEASDPQEIDHKTQNQNFVIPQEEIARVVTEKLAGMADDIKNILQEEIKPTKTWMKELQDQLLMRSIDYDNKYEDVKKKIFEIQAKKQLQDKHVQRNIGQLRSKQASIESFSTYFKDYVKDILNFSSVINHIVIQDEIDRQGIALYALKSSKNIQNSQIPTVQLDQNCLSCQSKNTGLIQQAFKMACLTYNPSQIRIDDQMFSREEILQISTGILEKLKKKLWTSESTKLSNSNNLVSYQTVEKQKEIARKVNNKTPRKSSSTLKDSSMASRQSSRSKELQTLLPLLGGGKPDKRQRKTQLSLFY